MNKERKVIDFAYLTMCAENDYIYETGEAKALLDYIENLQQENQQLHNKIDKAIEYMEHYIKVEERKYNDNVMQEFKLVIKLLKGNGVDE